MSWRAARPVSRLTAHFSANDSTFGCQAGAERPSFGVCPVQVLVAVVEGARRTGVVGPSGTRGLRTEQFSTAFVDVHRTGHCLRVAVRHVSDLRRRTPLGASPPVLTTATRAPAT